MPTHNFPVAIALEDKAVASDHLANKGLVMAVEVGVLQVLAADLTKRGKPIPSPQSGTAMIDTGAFRTAIDESAIIALGIQPTGQAMIGGQGGPKLQNLYQVEVAFPGSPFPKLPMEVIGVQIKDQGIVGLIGRDILRYCVLVYNGQQGSWSLSF